MKKKTTLLVSAFAIAAGLILSGAQIPAKASAQEDAAVKDVTERWAVAYEKGDLKKISGFYTDDAKLLPEGSGAIAGRNAILAYFEKNLRPTMSGTTIKFKNYEIYEEGAAASSVSEMEIHEGDGRLALRGKQILVLLKQDGQWKIHRDIWTNDGPTK